MKLVLTGVPGCGKTTIANLMKEVQGYHVVNFGSVMFELSQTRFGLEDRDEMRRVLSPRMYKRIQAEAGLRIGGLEGKVIVDTHASIRTKYGYYPGLPKHVLDGIDPDVIALIEHYPATILTHRKLDLESGARLGRDKEAERGVQLHQEMNRYFIAAYASMTGCYVALMNLRWTESYPFEHAEKTVEQIIDIFGEIGKSPKTKKVEN
ncbi:MAG: adenylate kinase [Candidatus Ranarchaeia archaeon]